MICRFMFPILETRFSFPYKTYIYPRYIRIWFYTTHITVDTNDYTQYAIQKAEVAVTKLTEIYPAQQRPSLDQSHHQESK